MFDSLLTVAFGILLALMGFGKVPVSKNSSKNEEYLKKYGKVLRVGGIILAIIGIVLSFSR